jgi:hypothetical protein
MINVEIIVVPKLNPIACKTSGWRKFSTRFAGDIRRNKARIGKLKKMSIGMLSAPQMPFILICGVGGGGDWRVVLLFMLAQFCKTIFAQDFLPLR